MAVGTAYDWSGVYLGGHVGFGWMPSTDRIDPANASAVDAFATGFVRDAGIATSVPLDSKGAMGGGQIGYNWQFSPNWVSGIEADISATNFKATNSLLNTQDFTRPMTAHQQLNWLGTVRGRLGFTPGNRFLVYGTGGFAYGNGNLSTALSRATGCFVTFNCQQGSTSGMMTGWAAGAGVEWAFLNSWTLKLEYLHFDLGVLSHLMVDPINPSVFNAHAGFKGDVVRVGINYLFSPSSVVARY
jgi:outer membrane immunogenic protein